MYWFKYRVKWYDTCAHRMNYGLVCGPTYVNVMTRISDYYGEDNVEEVEIICIDNGEVFPITKGMYAIIDEEIPYYEVREDEKDGKESV